MAVLDIFLPIAWEAFMQHRFFSTAQKNIPDLDAAITNGDYKPLLDWLRTSVHVHGRRFTSEELCERICGETLNIDHFIHYATDKYKAIYGF